jgi:hypothetical protein
MMASRIFFTGLFCFTRAALRARGANDKDCFE